MKQTWVFKWWYLLRLKRQQGLPYKLKNETEAIQANCILEILEAIEPLWLSIKRIIYKLGVKTIQNNRCRLHRYDKKANTVLSNPLYSQNQISTIIRSYWFGLVVIVGFVVAESSLYFLNASLFVPGGSKVMKLTVAIFLAVLTMVAFDWGIKQHFKFQNLPHKGNTHEQDSVAIKHQNDLRRLGYLLIGFALIATVFAGVSRVFFLENVDVTGLSPEKQHAVREASKWGSLLTLVVTILVSILLVVVKREHAKVSGEYDVLRYWLTALKRRNNYTQELIRNSEKIFAIVEKLTERHWTLVIDLKRIFKTPQEFDSKFEDLNKEYTDLRSRPGFTLNESTFRKFSCIQSAHHELFRFGVVNSPELREKLALLTSGQKSITDYLASEFTAFNKQQVTLSEPAPSLNGKSKDSLTPH